MTESDRRLLALIANGFDSYSELAEELDIGRSIVRKRVRRLARRYAGDRRVRMVDLPELARTAEARAG